MAHIRLNNIHLRIPVYDSNALRLFKRRGRKKTGNVGSHDFVSDGVLQVQALSDVTMNLEHNDRVALIGHNGAGKTTLLRYIAGIYPAVSGTRDVSGSVYMYGGTTINPDATGYENVRLAMQLYRLPMEKLAEYQRDIEQFTELGEYLEMPTRVYSAGMTARLSFAIAAMCTPDILLIDEGIGAGDTKFTDTVEDRIKHFTEKSSIVVLASHSDALLRKICNKGAVFDSGRMVYFGELESALGYYERITTAGKIQTAA